MNENIIIVIFIVLVSIAYTVIYAVGKENLKEKERLWNESQAKKKTEKQVIIYQPNYIYSNDSVYFGDTLILTIKTK